MIVITIENDRLQVYTENGEKVAVSLMTDENIKVYAITSQTFDKVKDKSFIFHSEETEKIIDLSIDLANDIHTNSHASEVFKIPKI